MSQKLLTAFQYLNLAGVFPNSFDKDFISWKTKLSIIFVGVFPTYNIILRLEESYNNHKDIAAFLLVIGFLVFWIHFLLSIITPALNPTLMVKFFQIIEEAQETISSLDISRPDLPSKNTQLWYIGIFRIIPVVATVLLLASHITIFHLISIILVSAVQFSTFLKIKLMLLLLNGKFEILNHRLQKLIDEPMSSLIDESMSNLSKTDIDVDSFLIKLHSIKYVKPKTSSSVITVDQILKFNKAHFQLCDAHKMLDSIFSLSALTGTFCVSFFIISAFATAMENSLVGGIHFYCISFLLMFLFIFLLHSATNVKNNCQKTGYLVHELLNEELPFEVEEELQLFSRTLCLRKIGLSAQGFFFMDLKLLTKMICTLAPLILIMVQRKYRAIRLTRHEI